MHVFCSFNFMCRTRSLGIVFNSGFLALLILKHTQVELILTTEDLLRSRGWHKRFITGKKIIEPNLKASIADELDKMENDNVRDSYIVRFSAWIYFGFKEFNYQLWGGKPYDTLEELETVLNSNLVR